jgi:hypothetical protein
LLLRRVVLSTGHSWRKADIRIRSDFASKYVEVVASTSGGLVVAPNAVRHGSVLARPR